MSIRTKESSPPSGFPPARLFLDDVEEIIRIFYEVVETDKDSTTKLVITSGDQEGDEISDLRKIGTNYRELNIKVTNRVGAIHLSIHMLSGSVWFTSFKKEKDWLVFQKLEPIFKRRKSYWRGLVPWWAAYIAFVGAFELIAYLVAQSHLRWLAAVGIFLLAVILGLPHTTVAYRNSWEPSPILSYIKEKIVPLIIGALLGVAGTYLKHKYWP